MPTVEERERKLVEERSPSEWPRIRVYDSALTGHETFDHYTVAVQANGRDPYGTEILFFGDNDLGAYSGNLCDANQTFVEGALSREGNDLVGKRVPWKELPFQVKRNILKRLEEV